MKRLALALALLSTSALAQTPPPNEQALSAKLLKEINEGLQCSAAMFSAQAQNQSLAAEVKRLKDKYEPEKPKEEKPNAK